MAITPNLAVIIDNSPDTIIDDYLKGVADLVKGENITHASRVAGGRVCIFLKSEVLVQQVTQDGFISVKDQYIPIRRFNTASTKVVLSNVFPFITNEMITEQLRKYGNLTAPVRDLLTGSKLNNCAHIKSFRKICYVMINDLSKVPSSINFDIEGKKVTVYLTMDEVTCHKCKENGHIAKHCKQLTVNEDRTNSNHTFANVANFPLLVPTPNVPVTSFAHAVSKPIHLRPENPISGDCNDKSVTTLKVTTRTAQERLQAYQTSRQVTEPKLALELNTVSENNSDTISTVTSSGPQLPPSSSSSEISVDVPVSQEYVLTPGQTLMDPTPSHTIPSPKIPGAMDYTPFKNSNSSDTENITDEDAMSESGGSTSSLAEDVIDQEMSNINDKGSEPNDVIFTPVRFKELMKKSRHFKKIVPIIKHFSTDYEAVLRELDIIIKNSKDINVKRKLNRMTTALVAELAP